MFVAYHFNADAFPTGGYDHRIEQPFFTAILRADLTHEHFKVARGDLSIAPLLMNHSSQDAVFESLLGYSVTRWRAMDPEHFLDSITSSSIYVLAADGISSRLRDHLHLQLGSFAWYVGAIEVSLADQYHWKLYQEKLIPTYRVLGTTIRVFHRQFDPESTQHAENLQRQLTNLPFTAISKEDIGVKATLLDPFHNHENAKRLAQVTDEVADHLGRVAATVVLRLDDLNPKLKEPLRSALNTYHRIETTEDVAQVATSCRRFIIALADTLHPPTTATPEGRKLGQEEYKNRLWKYIKDASIGNTQEKAILASFDDIGKRLDRLDDVANSKRPV